MDRIKLTRGKYALIDSEDYERVSQFTWNCLKIGYAQCNRRAGEHSRKYMHRFILDYPDGLVDHINGDKLDNRKFNLRVCNQSSNSANAKKSINNTSGFKGVSWDKKAKKWGAYLTKNYKHIFCGYFEDKEVAAAAYNARALKEFGEFAKLNKI